MSTIDLLFCTNPHNPLSWMIRAGSWSQWSHVAIIDGDDVIEAVALDGVVVTPLATRQAADPTWQRVTLPCANPEAIIAASRSQLGKPYDYTGVLGIGLHRDWQETGRWFCSELVAWAFQQGGTPLFRKGASGRVTPQEVWTVPPANAYSAVNASMQPA